MKTNVVITSVLLLLLLGACGPGAPPTQEQLDLVVTAKEPTYRFDQAMTYALPDKVVVISDPGTTPQEVDPALSQHVLQTISGQLNSRGYTQVTPGRTPPSFFVEVSKVTTTHVQYYYDYWYSYYGAYYAPYYDGAYGVGWAPVAVPYVTSSTLGSLIINVTDPNHPNTQSKRIPSEWAAVINGVIDNSSTANIQARVDKGIQQAFTQSPYFTRTTP